MSNVSLNYARALADALPEKSYATAADELAVLAQAITADDVRAFLDAPRVSQTNKAELLAKTVGKKVSHELANLLQVLIMNRRQAELSAIATDFKHIAAAKSGELTAEIESAKKLSDKQLQDLTRSLEKMTGKKVQANVTENASLIGGVKVAIDGDIIDLSLAGKYTKLTKALAA